jgi:hypothetical protein
MAIKKATLKVSLIGHYSNDSARCFHQYVDAAWLATPLQGVYVVTYVVI